MFNQDQAKGIFFLALGAILLIGFGLILPLTISGAINLSDALGTVIFGLLVPLGGFFLAWKI